MDSFSKKSKISMNWLIIILIMTDNDNTGVKHRLLEESPPNTDMDYNPNLHLDLNDADQREEFKYNYGEFLNDASPNNAKSDYSPTMYDNFFLEQQIFIPSSTRRALVAKWDQEKQKHILRDQDRVELEKRGLLYVWDMTANEIARDRKMQPMNYYPPIWYRLLLNLIRIFVLLIFVYIEIFLWSIFLMNVVQCHP